MAAPYAELTKTRITTISLLSGIRKRGQLTAELSTQKRLGNALFYGIAILLAYLVYLIFEPFLVPLAWAVVLVVVSYPVYERLAQRWKPTAAAAATTLRRDADSDRADDSRDDRLCAAGRGRGAFGPTRIGERPFCVGQRSVDAHSRALPGRDPDGSGDARCNIMAELAAAYIAAAARNCSEAHGGFLFHLSVDDSGDVLSFSRRRFDRGAAARCAALRRSASRANDQRRAQLIFASVTSSLVAAAAHGVLGGLAFALDGNSRADFLGSDDGIFLAGSRGRLGADLGSGVDQPDGRAGTWAAESF